ncbi:PQQ-dependent sugar dehydrogenase, partial [Rhodococcus erythropolis]|nr:PQQ-dependent sugar dehydrogenase [Rhodococcus erythropolis]
MRHPKLAALTVALTAVLVMPVTQSVAQPFPFDPGSFGNGSTGSLGGDDPDIPIENTLPQLSVTTLVDGLDHPWDVVAAPDGAILTGQRSGGFFVRRGDNTTGPVSADLSDLYAQSETGLMGIALA